jgi:hypothetical protein
MRRRDLIWGGALILVGLLFLLETLDIINVNVWGVIWSLALIVVGLWIIGWITLDNDQSEAEKISIPMEGAQSARIKIRHGAGRLGIESGAGLEEVLSGKISGGTEYQSKMTDGKIDLFLGAPGRIYVVIPFIRPLHWSLNLNGQIPLELDIKTGASESRIDLSQLKVTDLRLDTGASDTVLTMPSAVPHTRAIVKSGVASVRINIPEGVAARIRATGGLSNISIDRDRFPRSGRYHQSSDYEEAEYKVELDLSIGVGSFIVR